MLGEYFRRWQQKRRRYSEIAEELRFHLEMRSQENLLCGMPREEAEWDARWRFGDMKAIQAFCRQIVNEDFDEPSEFVRHWRSRLEIIVPGALVVGLLLPLLLLYGIVPHRLQPLPYATPQELLLAKRAMPFAVEGEVENELWMDWLRQESSFADMAAFRAASGLVRLPSSPPRLELGMAVSRNFFSVLGVAPALGSTFSSTNARLPEIVLSHQWWAEEFGANQEVAGSSLRIDHQTFRVAGVMSKDFWFLTKEPRFWIPIEPEEIVSPSLSLVARTAAGASMTPGFWKQPNAAAISPAFAPLQLEVRRHVRWPFTIVAIAFGATLALGFVQLFRLKRTVAPAKIGGFVMAKYYGFILGKSLVALPTPAAVWVVLSEPTVADDFAWLPGAWLVLPTLLFLLFCYAIVRWAVADQNLRCHVCLRPLRMPVSLGRLGSILFELPATEYICPHGHGTLHVPEPPVNEMDGPKWKPQDDAWEALLVAAKK